MAKSIILQTLAIGLVAAAGWISMNLYSMHMGGSAAPLLGMACGDNTEAGSANCEEVIKSRYGYWPPLKEGESQSAKHKPVALLGMEYYAVLAVWLIAVGRPSRRRSWVQIVPLAINLIGLGFSAWFMSLMFSKTIDYWCPLCAVTHVLNLLLFITLILLWPWGRSKIAAAASGPGSQAEGEAPPAEAAAGAPNAEKGRTVPALPTPTNRHLVATGLAMLIAFGLLETMNREVLARRMAAEGAQYKKFVEVLRKDTKRLVSLFDMEEPADITIEPDDPVRGGKPGEPALSLVVWSDFECVFCKHFADRLERDIQPLFDGNLRVYYKHYPLGTACNQVSRDVHPHACRTSHYAEAAHLLGGNEAFWKAHDYLFGMRDKLAVVTPESFARALNLDLDEFKKTLQDPRVDQRMQADMKELRKIRKHVATPAVYLAGRPINGLMRQSIDFWDQMADRYWHRIRKMQRPVRTRLSAVEAKKTTAPGEKSTKAIGEKHVTSQDGK